MFTIFKNLFKTGKHPDIAKLQAQGAIILDVRTKKEYASGHIRGSLNIPVNELPVNLFQLPNNDRPVITCCASGTRSKAALALLEKSGYKTVYNGGSWTDLQHQL